MYTRADTIMKHPDLFKSLKEAGLECLTVGFESFKDEELNYLNKRTSVEINNEAIRILKKLGIYIHAHFIINLEYTEEDFYRIFRYVSEKSLYRPAFPVLTPLPGTELYAETIQRVAIKDYDLF